jgi:hypothetical protein
MRIACFDIGRRNFAFAVLSYRDQKIEIENLQNTDLGDGSASDLYMALIHHLDLFVYEWDECSVFLIEQQMSTRHHMNIVALKIAQHVYSYFLHRYGTTKRVIEYPAYHKTRCFTTEKMTKARRKKWSVEKVTELFGDGVIASFPKKDDVCDCVLMGFTYFHRYKE